MHSTAEVGRASQARLAPNEVLKLIMETGEQPEDEAPETKS